MSQVCVRDEHSTRLRGGHGLSLLLEPQSLLLALHEFGGGIVLLEASCETSIGLCSTRLRGGQQGTTSDGILLLVPCIRRLVDQYQVRQVCVGHWNASSPQRVCGCRECPRTSGLPRGPGAYLLLQLLHQFNPLYDETRVIPICVPVASNFLVLNVYGPDPGLRLLRPLIEGRL